jgi:hypothetical protein
MTTAAPVSPDSTESSVWDVWDVDAWQTMVQLWQHLSLQPQAQQDSQLLRQLEFLPGLQQILLTRQVHALEHATVWVLSGTPRSSLYRILTLDDDRFGGLSTDKGFFLYGDVDTAALDHAVHKALHRLHSGEWHLAIHPRCGTNLAVAIALTTTMTLGSHVLLPKDPLSQCVGLGTALTLSTQLAPEMGKWVQQHLTTAIPFNLVLDEIRPVQDAVGRAAHFVSVTWRDFI